MDKVDDIIVILGKEADSNCYIFDDVIVDPGSGLNIDYLLDSIKEADIDMKDINKIVNTHCHYDHIGADKYLQDEYGLDIYMHELDKKIVESKDVNATVASSFNEEVPELSIKTLDEGDMFGKYKVIHTPGHTCGGICLTDGKSLISGDTLFSGGNFGRTDLPTGNNKDMRESIEKIVDLDVVQLFPGHGPYAISAVAEQINMAYMIASKL